MKVLFILPSIDISLGGPSYSTVNLCYALAQNGAEIALFTTRPTGEVPKLTGQGYEVRYFPRSWPQSNFNSNGMIDEIQRVGRSYDIIDISSLWNMTSARAMTAANEIDVPYISTPRGMLSAWNRGPRNLHKEVFYKIVHHKQIKRARLLRYLTKQEAENSSKVVGNVDHAIVSNGIWPGEFESLDGTKFLSHHNLNHYSLVTFLGRLNCIKRLDLQCEAFRILAPQFPDLHWAFIGPDDGMGNIIKKRMHDAGLTDRVIMTGLLSGYEKLAALTSTTVYCHTSDHEGHSVAITEALACGKPCVITEGCNFDRIAEVGAGIVTPSDPNKIASAIASILGDSSKLTKMSKQARLLAVTDYSWLKVAKDMIEVYRYAIGNETNKPGFIVACKNKCD